MKRINYLLFILPFLIASCEDDIREIKTDFPLSIPISIEPDTSLADPDGSGYAFSTEETIYLTDNEDVRDHLCNMVYAVFTGYYLNIEGLEDGEILDTLKITSAEGYELLAFSNYDNAGGGNKHQRVFGCI